jgi:putative ABC transport system substrate-binding protein
MRELGWVEDSTVQYLPAYPERELQGEAEMIAHAEKLVALKPDVIWLASSISAQILVLKVKHAIPVVGSAVSEVVERGLAKSLQRPGGIFTGVSNFSWELGVKRFEILRKMMPKLARVGVLIHPANKNCAREFKLIQEAAAPVRVQVIAANMARESDMDAAFRASPAFPGAAQTDSEAYVGPEDSGGWPSHLFRGRRRLVRLQHESR